MFRMSRSIRRDIAWHNCFFHFTVDVTREKIYHWRMTQIPPAVPGAALKRLREAKGLTQQAFADKLGKSRTAVAAWEYGRAMSPKSRIAVAKLLGCDPDVLGPPWNPHGARPRYRQRQREEAAYMETLRTLASGGSPSAVGVDPDTEGGVNSSPSTSRNGGLVMAEIPDADQFEKVLGFWRAMEPTARLQLVREAWSLASPPAAEGAHGRRGKAQG